MMRRSLLVCALWLFACKKTSAGERCEMCAMHIDTTSAFVAELREPAGSVHYYDAPRCAFEALSRHPDAQLWVREYYEQTPRPAEQLRFVEQSDVIGPMGPDLIPVEPAQVTQFVATHGGGRISSFEEAAARFRAKH